MRHLPKPAIAAAALASFATPALAQSTRTPYTQSEACAIFTVTETNRTGGRYYVRDEADGSRTYAIGDQIAEGGIETSEVNVGTDGRIKLASRFHVSATTPHAQSLGVTAGDFTVSAERDYMGTTIAITTRPLQPAMTPLIENAQVLTAAKVNMLHITMRGCMSRVRQYPELLRR